MTSMLLVLMDIGHFISFFPSTPKHERVNKIAKVWNNTFQLLRPSSFLKMNKMIG